MALHGGRVMLARLLLLMRNSVAAPGQQVFTSSGTFTVPAGVTSICAVAVGRGQDGAAGDGMGTPGRGGDGGTLSYSNAISVTPAGTEKVPDEVNTCWPALAPAPYPARIC